MIEPDHPVELRVSSIEKRVEIMRRNKIYSMSKCMDGKRNTGSRISLEGYA